MIKRIPPWVPPTLFVIQMVILHFVVLGSIQWTSNSTGGRAAAATIGILLTVLVYIQEIYYGYQIVFGVVKGVHTVNLFVFGIMSSIYAQATIFYVMAALGEVFTLLPPVAQAFDVFYRFAFPLAAGVYMSAGNVSSTPVGIPGHLWWVWTSFVGGIHLLFMLGFGMARLTQYWANNNKVSVNTALEFNGQGIRQAIGMKKNYKPPLPGTRRRNKTPPKMGSHMPTHSLLP